MVCNGDFCNGDAPHDALLRYDVYFSSIVCTPLIDEITAKKQRWNYRPAYDYFSTDVDITNIAIGTNNERFSI